MQLTSKQNSLKQYDKTIVQPAWISIMVIELHVINDEEELCELNMQFHSQNTHTQPTFPLSLTKTSYMYLFNLVTNVEIFFFIKDS